MNHSTSLPQSSLTRRTFVQAGAATVLTASSWQRVWGANERVGVGFIGYGLIGKRHVLDFKEERDVDLVAIAETHRGRLEQANAIMGSSATAYRDFRKLLDNRAVDAVVVSTPDHWHALMTMMACAAGKDVYVEKPLTLFVREGRWMIDVAKRHQRVVQVGTQQRSGPHYQRARELIRSGYLGKVSSVRMTASRNIMPGYGTPPDHEAPPELDWEMWLGPARWHPYNPNRAIYHFRWFWDYSGGQMTNLGAHALDIVDWYLGGVCPTAVASAGGRFSLLDNGETPDTQDALIEFPGWTAVWSHREASAGRAGSGGLEFFGPKGSMLLSRSGLVVTPDRKLPPGNTVPQFSDAHPAGGPVRTEINGPAELWTKAIEDKSGNSRDQFQRHVRNFVDGVKSRRQPLSDLESAHRAATVCHLANLSLRLGRKIRWDAQQEEIVGDAEAAKLLLRPYRQPWDAVLKSLGVS